MARDHARFKSRKISGAFFMMPGQVLLSPAFRRVSAHAAKLLLDLGSQFNGHNNGDQCAAWRLMKQQGWKSRDTLGKAKRELLAAGLIEKTKQGGLHAPTLFAFTWLPIAECRGKLDVPATKVASGKWNDRASAADRPAMPDTPAVSARHAGRANWTENAT